VSTFQQEIEVVLDGEVFKCRTKAIDWTNAERQLVRDGGEVAKDTMALRFRLAYVTFKRCHPGESYASAFGVFLDALDDIVDEAQAEDGDPMDPTPLAESGD
jgi:hypothetical protein